MMSKTKIIVGLLLLIFTAVATAGSNSNPGLYYGQVPSAGQWNSYFSAKLDYLPGAANSVPYWDASGNLLSVGITGDCTAAANIFTCRTLQGYSFANPPPTGVGSSTAAPGYFTTLTAAQGTVSSMLVNGMSTGTFVNYNQVNQWASATATTTAGTACASARGSLAAPAASQLGDVLCAYDVWGYTGSAWGYGASIDVLAGGAWSGSSTPTYLAFNTTSAGSAAPLPSLYVTPNGLAYVTASGLTALGTTQGTAYAITAQQSAFSTVGAGTGAILPAPVVAGLRIMLDNDGANALLLYPQVGGSIDGGAANAPITIPAGAVWEGIAESTTAWTTYESVALGTANQMTITPTAGTNTWSLPSNLIFPGNASATLGLLAIGTFSGAYTDGIIVDYAAGNGRISVGASDTITLYTGGLATTQMVKISNTATTVPGLSLGTSGAGKVTVSGTVPTIASGFGTGAAITQSNGTATFTLNVGTITSAVSGVVTMPAATTGWSCTASPTAAPQAAAIMYVAPTSTTSITISNYTLTTGAALVWASNTVIAVNCVGY